MINRRLIRFLLYIIATFVGYCQAQAQTEFPPAYNNQAHYAVGDLVTDYGNIYRCEATVSKPYLDPSKTYANWELFFVRSNTTITIGTGQPFPTLAVAWKYVQNARIAEASYLHLSIVTTGGAHTETFSAPLSLDHNSGSQVSIIGDNASNVTLSFPNTNGLTLDYGHSLGSISAITLAGGSTSDGIYGTSGAVFCNIDHLNLTGFYNQVDLEQGSSLSFGTGIAMTGCQNDGILLDDSSLFVAPGGLNFTGAYLLGAGIQAAHGSHAIAQNCTFSYSSVCVVATQESMVDVRESTFVDGERDCVSSLNSYLDATECTFSSSYYDLNATYQGVILAYGYSGMSTYTANDGHIYTS